MRPRLVVYVTNMSVSGHWNKVQEEFWGRGPYPPRTIIEVHRLNQTIFSRSRHLRPCQKMKAALRLALGVEVRT